MSTPPGWEPRPGPTRGDPARRAPRGAGGLARDDADPRRQGQRGGVAGRRAAAGGRPELHAEPRPVPRDGAAQRPAGHRAAGQGVRPGIADGYDRRGPRPDDFAGGRGRPARAGRSDRGRPGGGLTRLRRPAGPAGPGALARPDADAGRPCSCSPARPARHHLHPDRPARSRETCSGSSSSWARIAAALGIRRGKVYLLFPAPALAFFVAAVVTGKVHDAKLGSSTAGLGAGFTQWVAGIFFPAVVATILVLLIGGGRWLLGRQLITGQSPLPRAGRPGNARPARATGRPAVDSWADDRLLRRPGPAHRRRPDPRQDRPDPVDGQPAPTPARATGPAPPSGTGPTPGDGTGPTPPASATGPAPAGRPGPRPSRATRPGRRRPSGNRPPRPPRPAARTATWGDPRPRPTPAGPRPRRTARAARLQPAPPRPPIPPEPRAPARPAQPRDPGSAARSNPGAGTARSAATSGSHRPRRVDRAAPVTHWSPTAGTPQAPATRRLSQSFSSGA